MHLGELHPDSVRVELYAAPSDGGPAFVSAMISCDGTDRPQQWRTYAINVPASRPASDYTPRIVPSNSGARIPLEDCNILWFR